MRTRLRAKTVLETPVDQIFDGEWESDHVDKIVSSDPDTQPVRITGLGQDIPDATSGKHCNGDILRRH